MSACAVIPEAQVDSPSAPISESSDRPGIQDIWNGDVDTALLQYLVQVKKERNGTRDTFSNAVWTALGVHLTSLGHASYSSDELRDRLRILKKRGYTLSQTVSISPKPISTATATATAAPAASPFATTATPNPAPTLPISQPASDRAQWNADAESALVDYLSDAKVKGLMSENNFKNKVYTSAASYLRTKGHIYTHKQVKARWTRFKAEFKIVAKLRTLSGFGWDNARSMVTATDIVWDAYLNGHPKARPFRKNPFPHYNDIAALIGHSTATGAFALSSENSARGQDSDVSSEEEEGSDNLPDSDEDSSPVKKRQATAPAPTTPAPKRVRISAGAQALESMSSSVAALTEGLTSGALFASPASDSPVKKAKAFDIVRTEEGLSPYSLAKARRVFRGSGEVAREYLSFDSAREEEKEARHFWLLDEMERM